MEPLTSVAINPTDEAHLSVERAAALLRQQVSLQAEASRVIAELDLPSALASAGLPCLWGSYVTGLMAWRDLDVNVVAPGLDALAAFDVMLPLLTRSHVTEALYKNLVGGSGETALAADDRYFYMLKYWLDARDQPDVALDVPAGERLWKVDISFWIADPPREESLPPAAITSRLTEETRLAILWIKDTWRRLPEYRTSVYSVDIYQAVFDHGVRSPAEFAAYLAAREG